ncbi:hypothetical protein IW261DRAFT_135930 [Armillaria novae-zelandiae]|uniref:Uncharacterized protein n=1 Tax=Armillaria novae-zelandiae TaxID=153914 RepID=A0AA39NE81_9AGAR|nr:hypothetical protein IW261DRAFT_135930 [Armillaria novae-zelandiae]
MSSDQDGLSLEYSSIMGTQMDDVVAIAARAYDANPSICATSGGNKAIYGLFFRPVTRALVLEGKIWLAVSSGRIVGVLGGFGPGKFLWATEAQGALGFDDAYARLSEETKDWWQSIYGPQIKEFMDGALGETANLDGWMTPLLASIHPTNDAELGRPCLKE